jgi:glycosyltransferase involved in cell wall biosynthesis
MSSPLVSIITPVYKNVKWLSQTINSVIEQNYDNYEIIIVNDCSPEDVKSVLEPYKNNNKIHYYEHDKNKGAGAARNTGISNCNGQYILPLDSDDVINLNLNWLVDSINKIDENTIVTSQHSICDENMNPTGVFWPIGNELWSDIVHRCVIMNSSMYPKSMWTKLGGYDENTQLIPYEDWEFWIRAYKAGYRLNRMVGKYLNYRLHANNISKRVNSEDARRMVCGYLYNKHQDSKTIISELYRSILDREPDDSELDHYMHSYFSIEEIKHQLINSIKNNMKENLFFKDLPIYFVNLDRATGRLQTLLDSFESNNIKNYTRIPAIDVNTLQNDSNIIYSPNHIKFSNPISSLGHYACLLSFFKTYNEFLKSDYEYAFICEDDVDFSHSSKINFNFYDTLKYHNPEYYNLKTSAVNQNILKSEYCSYPVCELLKPDHLTYGWSSIVNKKWVKSFLERYNAIGISDYSNFIFDARGYAQNYNNSRSDYVVPAIDTISYDDHTFLWISFAPSVHHYSGNIDNGINEKSLEVWHNASFYYCEYLNNTQTISIDTFAKFYERKQQITQLYLQILNRQPDEAGLMFYIKSLYSYDQIKNIFINSDEFKNKSY